MSVNNRGFLVFVFAILAIAFFVNQRMQSADTRNKLATLTPPKSTPFPVAVASLPTQATDQNSSSVNSQVGAASQMIVEPETAVMPEVTVLRKNVATYALQEFGKSIGVELRPTFEIEHFEFSSLDAATLKFHASSGDGRQSMTVLAQKGNGVRPLIDAYLTDLDIKGDRVKYEESGPVVIASVTDSEGEHVFIASLKGDEACLIALTRETPPFAPAELSDLQSLFKPNNQ